MVSLWKPVLMILSLILIGRDAANTHNQVELFSLMFERAHGWTGLLVEPHPLIFAKVTRRRHRHGHRNRNRYRQTHRQKHRYKHRHKHRRRFRQDYKQPGGNLKRMKTHILRGCRCKGKHGVLRLALQQRISRFPGVVYDYFSVSSIFSIFRPHFAKFSSEPIAGVMAGLVPDTEGAPPVNGSSMSEVAVIIMWNVSPRKAFLTPLSV